ncbi:hypothetical protein KKA69_06755 [Patescibacteria group bacterium]|nr:hypothetical protein [Patescibacteria group bacterium]
MPSWSKTKEAIANRNNDYDGIRRERIRAVEEISGRPLIIYATAFLERSKVVFSQGEVGIDNYDPIGFDEVISVITGDNLDVLLHSPGGSPEAAESIVSLLRSRFTSLRFIVPHIAKSAATMICCAGDEILMDERSELGPIDPQMQLIRGDGVSILAPAQAIIKQFDKAKETLADNPKQITAWLPILQPLGPSLLTECDAANKLSYKLVKDWLKMYMFRARTNAEELADRVAVYLGNSTEHLSHGRRIGIEQLVELEVNVTDLRQTPILREAIWNLYQAVTCTLQDTNAFKIIESGHDSAYIRQVMVQQIHLPSGAPPLPQPPPYSKPKRRKHR